MTDNNTFGKIEYIFLNAFASAVSMLWYRILIFMPLDNYTAGGSKKVLWVLAALTVALGIIINFKNNRSFFSVIINVLLPYEVYAVISYWHYFGSWIKAILLASLLLSLVFFGGVVFRKLKSKNTGAIIKRRVKYALAGVRIITALCLSMFIIPLSVSSFMGKDLYNASNGDTIVLNETDEWTIENNIDTVMKIKPDVWETLELNERLEVLSVLKNIEMRYLGINHEIYLSADNLNETTLGYYLHNEHKIVINIAHLKNSPVSEVVHTLAHECHHAYSQQQVEVYKIIPDEYKNMPMFYNAQVYENEYLNYVSGDKDYNKYAKQYCEAHANDYAKDAVKGYYVAIAKYEKG